jgi:hypothetical protein
MNRPIISRQEFAFLTRKQALDFLRSGGIFKPARPRIIPQFGASVAGGQMLQGDRTYSFDANLQLSDGAAAYTASGYAQVAGADGILDLGGNQGTSPTQQARIDAVCVIDISAITVSGTNTYKIKMMGCNTSAFASAVVNLSSIELGKGSSLVPTTQSDGAAGRIELPFTTERLNTKYEFVKLYNELANSPSITYTAFVAVLPEP